MKIDNYLVYLRYSKMIHVQIPLYYENTPIQNIENFTSKNLKILRKKQTNKQTKKKPKRAKRRFAGLF